jgi:aminopeptidase
MHDPRVDKLAEVLLHHSVSIRPKDKVVIDGSVHAAPLIEAVYVEALKAGAYPTTRVGLPDLTELYFRHASDDQLAFVPPAARTVQETYDVYVSIKAESNTKALSSVPSSKLAFEADARRELNEIFLRRMRTGEIRWTNAVFPTAAQAQEAEMGFLDYGDFIFGASVPDLDDPVGYWQRFSARQQKLVEWFRGKRTVRVQAPDTDVRMSIAGRTFVNGDGRVNMPDGEIFTGPVENSVEGHVRFSIPVVHYGRRLEGVHLWFEKGKVVKATADRGEEVLQALDIDEGARYIGEFAIGTNAGINRPTGDINIDEKTGGSFHMAVGSGYPETGSLNQSAIHGDLVCDLKNGGRIWVDDELVYENGQFLILA